MEDDAAGHDSYLRKRRRDEPEFVSAGNLMRSKKAAAEEEEEEERLDLPTQLGRQIAEGARARRERAAAARRRRQASSVAAAPGSLELKYRTVAKMMATMGYKAGTGLGKNAQGIVTPLVGVPRPGHAGLGSVEEPKPPFSGKESLPPPPPASAEEEHPRWSKKGSARKPKDPVLTKNASLAMRVAAEREQPMVVDEVIDKRGPQARVLKDLRGLNDEHDMEEANDDHAPLPKLQYNLRLLVDEAADDIARPNAQLRREQENVATLIQDKERLVEQEASQGHELQVMETIAGRWTTQPVRSLRRHCSTPSGNSRRATARSSRCAASRGSLANSRACC